MRPMMFLIALCILITGVNASAQQMAPDGTYVGGSPQMAPDGTYVGGRPQMAPDGTYVGGY